MVMTAPLWNLRANARTVRGVVLDILSVSVSHTGCLGRLLCTWFSSQGFEISRSIED
jgi:hypothetical protein